MAEHQDPQNGSGEDAGATVPKGVGVAVTAPVSTSEGALAPKGAPAATLAPPGHEGVDDSSGPDSVSSIDWTTDEATPGTVTSPVAGPTFTIEDHARRTIAFLLIWLLIGLITAIVALLAFGRVQVTEVKEFAVLLGPIVTLVSAATGFYYGTKTK